MVCNQNPWLLEQGLSQAEQGNELSELGIVDANQGTSPKSPLQSSSGLLLTEASLVGATLEYLDLLRSETDPEPPSRHATTGDRPGMPKSDRIQDLIFPKPKTQLRPLTVPEIESLEHVLGKPVERDYLVYWLTTAMQDVIRLLKQPTARKCRDDLFQIVQEGRSWLERLGACPGTTVLPPSVELGRVTATVAKFCDRIDFVAKQIDRSVGRGHPPTPIPMTAFIEKMIGIAKRARVLPSTPSRAERTSGRPVPAFLKFVETALAIARDVVESSPLPDNQKSAALLILRVQSRKALVKVIENLRGPIGNYQDSPGGLTEWTSAD